jgi:hypothetical protein
MTVAILAAFALGIALPHLMSLDGTRPITAALLWLTSLSLRLLLGVFVVLWVLLVLPTTEIYKVLVHWCVHAEAHSIGIHFDVQGHAVGWVASWFPLVALVGAVALALTRTVRAVRSVDQAVATDALGHGPGDSLIVGGPEILLAATGFARPRVLISTGALAALDDEELAAGLAHESGHIARRHHVVLAYAACCRAGGRLIPGTRRAVDELHFHIERDADEWALRRDHDPFALASAICKAATMSGASDGVLTALGGGALDRRLDRLASLDAPATKPLYRRVVDCGAIIVCCLAVAASIAIPAEALGAVGGDVPPHGHHHCVS